MNPLYQTRKMRAEKAARAAAGNPIALTDEFSDEARAKILFAMRDFAPQELFPTYNHWADEDQIKQVMTAVLLRRWGRRSLSKENNNLTVYVTNFANDDEMVDIVEVFGAALFTVEHDDGILSREKIHDAFRVKLNEILDDHDIAWQLVGKEMLPRDSMVLHAEVIGPTLSLLHGDRRFEDVDRAFQAALRELKPGGDPGDAITDAGTALQAMFEALGAPGKTLGAQIPFARKAGLLGDQDSELADKVADWVRTQRNRLGDAHHGSQGDRDDAWLAVHVVGALILRLEARARR